MYCEYLCQQVYIYLFIYLFIYFCSMIIGPVIGAPLCGAYGYPYASSCFAFIMVAALTLSAILSILNRQMLRQVTAVEEDREAYKPLLHGVKIDVVTSDYGTV
jgi:hypothetical protein